MDEESSPLQLDLNWFAVPDDKIFEEIAGAPWMARALGGDIPSPTLMVLAGCTLQIDFINSLTYQDTARTTKNRYSDPDVVNSHLHRGHVSSVAPGDDVTLQIGPQEKYHYKIEFPADHMPRLYWIHPHHHGSTSLH